MIHFISANVITIMALILVGRSDVENIVSFTYLSIIVYFFVGLALQILLFINTDISKNTWFFLVLVFLLILTSFNLVLNTTDDYFPSVELYNWLLGRYQKSYLPTNILCHVVYLIGSSVATLVYPLKLSRQEDRPKEWWKRFS